MSEDIRRQLGMLAKQIETAHAHLNRLYNRNYDVNVGYAMFNRFKLWRKKCPKCGWRVKTPALQPCGLCWRCCIDVHSDLSPLERAVHDEVTG